jgi:uncharacterized protein (TIGR02099 family)
MRALLRKLLRWLAYTAATAVILLAMLVGIVRLLLPLVPEYQDEIRRLATDATGLTVDFQRITASWPLAGPELRLFDVTASMPDTGENVLDAEEFVVGINLMRLLGEREIAPSRVGVSRASVRVRRELDGTFMIQNQPLARFLRPDRDIDGGEIPDVVLSLNDIAVVYEEAARPGLPLELMVKRLALDLYGETLRADGDVQLEETFGRSIELFADLPTAFLRGEALPVGREPEWRASVAGKGLQLGRLLRFWSDEPVPVETGRGDVSLSGRFAGTRLLDFSAELDLEEVVLTEPTGRPEAYGSIAGRFEWQRQDQGWLLAGSRLRITRERQTWPDVQWSVRYQGTEGSRSVSARANFVRLQDLYPMMRVVAAREVREKLLPLALRGDLRQLAFDISLEPGAPARYELEAKFNRLGLDLTDGLRLSDLGGQLAADQDGGRLQIGSSGSDFVVPELFPLPIEANVLEGLLVWRVTESHVRVLSDNVELVTPFMELSSRFELSVPRAGGSPFIDLSASARSPDIALAVNHLPLNRMPPSLARWLTRAIVAGRMPDAQIDMRGELQGFPYAQSEGRFLIDFNLEDAILDYAEGWPRVEGMNARFVLDGVSLRTTQNRGVIAGMPIQDRDVGFEDLREGLLEISGSQMVQFEQLLGFVRSSPIADALGPTLARVRGSGELDGTMELRIPVLRPRNYELEAVLQPRDCDVSLDGVGFGLSAVVGRLDVRNTRVSANNLRARLLNEPVEIDIRPAEDADGLYSHFAGIKGTTPAVKWMSALSLPYPDRISGSFGWDAMVLIPLWREEGTAPLHVLVRSDLQGMESKLPAPLAKHPASAEQLDVDIAFPADGIIELTGELRRELSWALRLQNIGETWQIERGALHAGSATVVLPDIPGVELSGRLAQLSLGDWLALTDEGGDGRWTELYREAVVDIEELNVFGQLFRAVELEAQRGEQSWSIQVDSPAAVGTITVPFQFDGSRPLTLDMSRLWLTESAEEADAEMDPRDVVPVNATVADFAIGDMRFGSLETSLQRVPDGIMASPIQMTTESFTMGGDGAWLVESGQPGAQRSRLRLDLASSDVKPTLLSLGYDPLIEGDGATASLDITWAGPPAADFLERATGQFRVNINQGSLVELDPGGGRLLGVLSVAALPRRLSLDFSDVFDEGLPFETLRGDFSLDAGNAYTCNLGLEGSVADMGIVGRAGLKDEDYDQLAVVKPHMSSMLAIGGTVVGGPGIGAAMLLISQIFRKPLSALGESYYRVSGRWEDPEINRVQRAEVDLEPFRDCEQYLAQVLPNPQDLAEVIINAAEPPFDQTPADE